MKEGMAVFLITLLPRKIVSQLKFTIMKYKAFLVTICFLAASIFSANAQRLKTKNVPKDILKSFTDNNQNASGVKWIMEDKNFLVKYEVSGQDYEEVYSPLGNRLSSVKELKESMLPATILNNIKTQFPDSKLDEIDEMTVGQMVTYKIRLAGTPNLDVWYDGNGKFLRKQNHK